MTPSDPYDFLIVGGGAAGCVLANRLSADRVTRVCLVEAGPDHNARRAIVRIPLAMVSFMAPSLAFLGGARFMSWFETEPEPGLQGRVMALPRGQGSGGSTNVNGQIFIRGQREDFDHWAALGNPGWGYDELLPYFRKLETFEPLADSRSARHLPDLGPFDPAFHGTDGPLRIALPRSVNPMARVFLEASRLAGLSFNPDFNGAVQGGVGYYTFTQRQGERVTAEGAYLDPARNRPNLTVIPETRVTGLILEGGSATGVVWRRGGESGNLRAREVILAAGSFVSPQLLQLAGIGNARDLSRLGIEVRRDLPGVGENLQDHLDVTLEYRARTAVPYGVSWRAAPQNAVHVADWFVRRRGLFASTTAETGGFVSTVPGETRPNVQLFFCSGRANTQEASGFTGHGFLLHVCELRPGSIGRVTLRSADPDEKPSILYNFFRGKSDMTTLRDGIRLARRIAEQPPFARHLDAEMDPGPDATSDGALDAFIRQKVGTLFHPVGTCSMGTGDAAVVDPASLRVHGVGGVRVVDASIMPAIVSGNTVAATYCLAEKGADLILNR